MLPSCLYYIFVHLSQKARLRPELSPKFLSTLGPNPTRKARPDLQLCAKTFNKCKKISPEKSFWKLWVFFYPSKPQFSRLLGLLWFWREQNSEFPKSFFGGFLFVFVEYLCNRSPKIKTKNVKNYNSILVTANHRN